MSEYDEPGTKVLRPTYLAHIVLRTPSRETFEAMVKFYTTFLDAEVSYQNEILSFLRFDDEHHRIAIGILPGTIPQVAGSAGLAHVAFTYSNLHDLLLSYRQRKANGIVPFWCVNHGPTSSIYYHDPDGNEIETQVDNFDTPDQASHFMSGPEFAANPIGTDFDPEDLIERLRNGESETSLKRRVEIGSRQAIPVF